MRLFLAILLFFLSAPASAYTLCDKFSSRPELQNIIELLAAKLSYTNDELCNHPRINDIQNERRQVYYVDTDQYEIHTVITLHYREYACEYHYSNGRKEWKQQYCYSTW